MLWCSNLNTESVPQLVTNIHDIILLRTITQYVLVCTGLYYYTFPVLVCTRYVLVRTASEQVHTKYPVPVMHLTSGTPILGICLAYAWYIPRICRPPAYAWYIHGISLDIPCISMYIHQTGYTWYILGYPWIYHVYPSSIYIVYPWIYMVYH